MTAAVAAAKDSGAPTIGVNAEDGSRTDEGFLLEFATAAREAGADRVRYCDTIGGGTPGPVRGRVARLAPPGPGPAAAPRPHRPCPARSHPAPPAPRDPGPPPARPG